MAKYSANNLLAGTQQAVGASYKSLVGLAAATATLCRGKAYDVLIGTDGTPADNVLRWDISRQTAAGTGTSATPATLDQADTASRSTCLVNYTVEPTITAASSLFCVGINQRASYRWVAAPGSELVWPATNANGLALRVLSPGYTGTATGEILYEDQ